MKSTWMISVWLGVLIGCPRSGQLPVQVGNPQPPRETKESGRARAVAILDEAVKVARGASPTVRAKGWMDVAERLSRLDPARAAALLEAALEAAQAITDPGEKSARLLALAERFPDDSAAGRTALKQAAVVAPRIPGLRRRVERLREIAAAQAERGLESAGTTLEIALREAQGMGDPSSRIKESFAILEHWANYDPVTAATRIRQVVTRERNRITAKKKRFRVGWESGLMKAAALAMARADVATAVAWAKQVHETALGREGWDGAAQVRALLAVAERVEAQNPKVAEQVLAEALRWAREIRWRAPQRDALFAITNWYYERGNFQKIEEITGKKPTPPPKGVKWVRGISDLDRQLMSLSHLLYRKEPLPPELLDIIQTEIVETARVGPYPPNSESYQSLLRGRWEVLSRTVVRFYPDYPKQTRRILEAALKMVDERVPEGDTLILRRLKEMALSIAPVDRPMAERILDKALTVGKERRRGPIRGNPDLLLMLAELRPEEALAQVGTMPDYWPKGEVLLALGEKFQATQPQRAVRLLTEAFHLAGKFDLRSAYIPATEMALIQREALAGLARISFEDAVRLLEEHLAAPLHPFVNPNVAAEAAIELAEADPDLGLRLAHEIGDPGIRIAALVGIADLLLGESSQATPHHASPGRSPR